MHSSFLFSQMSRRHNGKRFVVEADEKLTRFLELELASRGENPANGMTMTCDLRARRTR